MAAARGTGRGRGSAGRGLHWARWLPLVLLGLAAAAVLQPPLLVLEQARMPKSLYSFAPCCGSADARPGSPPPDGGGTPPPPPPRQLRASRSHISPLSAGADPARRPWNVARQDSTAGTVGGAAAAECRAKSCNFRRARACGAWGLAAEPPCSCKSAARGQGESPPTGLAKTGSRRQPSKTRADSRPAFAKC